MTSLPFSIRRAAPADAAAIADLSTVLGYPNTPDAIAARLSLIMDSPNDLLIVATATNGEVVAWLHTRASVILESGLRAEITGVIVSPAHRRAGIGRALVAQAEHWARSLSAQALIVRSNVRRLESHAFYPALGFEPAKTQHVYRKRLSQ